MAWALAAGIGYKITPSMTLDIGYRYLNSGTINTLVNPQTGATIRQTNASQQIRVGFSTTFNRPVRTALLGAATQAEAQAWMKAKRAAEFIHASSVIALDAILLLGSGPTCFLRADMRA